MIRSENLRSGYIQDDVEEYLYQLLPERDAVVREMEDYAAQNRVPVATGKHTLRHRPGYSRCADSRCES